MDSSATEVQNVAEAVQTVWQYHHMGHDLPKKADGVMCLCSSDLNVAVHAAKIFLSGDYGWLLFSGGIGTGSHSGKNMLGWEQPEALVFRDAAIKAGVPDHAIHTEDASTNTGDNVRLSRALILEKGLAHESIVVVQKPFMERRAFATFKKVWPEPDISISSVGSSWDEYVENCELDQEMVVNIMVSTLLSDNLVCWPSSSCHFRLVIFNESKCILHLPPIFK